MAQGNIGVLFNNLRGKAGSVVFARGKDGTVVRPRVTGRNPRTPAQVAARARLTQASVAYKNLTPAQATLWRNYALGIVRHDPQSGHTYAPSAISAFTELACKFLQVTPAGTIPLTPPATSFGGDTIALTTAAGTSGVVFTAPAANAAGVKTELLLQPLKSQNRTPQPKNYRAQTVVAFATGALTANVAAPAGFYAPAYRFIKTATGQATELVPLPIVQVV